MHFNVFFFRTSNDLQVSHTHILSLTLLFSPNCHSLPPSHLSKPLTSPHPHSISGHRLVFSQPFLLFSLHPRDLFSPSLVCVSPSPSTLPTILIIPNPHVLFSTFYFLPPSCSLPTLSFFLHPHDCPLTSISLSIPDKSVVCSITGSDRHTFILLKKKIRRVKLVWCP